MDNPESKTGIDELKRPKKTRRISSILKAPRTPLKSIDPDNEDRQEETANPTEKKRNSRRVSFASTNDILVFANDFKNGSTLENLLQDLSGTEGETLHNVGIHAVKQPIIGMETLLNAPLHASQHQDKTNIAGCGAQNDFCDRTVVFSGEDNAVMDMTQSHTIIIDDEGGTDAAMPSCGKFDFASPVWGVKAAGFDNPRKEGTVLENRSTAGKGPIKESAFEAFLASLAQSGRLSSDIQSTCSATPFPEVPSPEPKVDAKRFLAKFHSAFDHETRVPLAPRMSARQDVSAQRQSEGTLLLEQENMDFTSWEQEDMEMTRDQTVVIKTRPCPMVNSSNGEAKDLAKLSLNKTTVFSDHGMDLTGTYEGCFEETQNPSSERNKMDRRSFPAINTISHLSQTDRMEKPHTQIKPIGISCLLPASSDSEDMEMTRDHTVVIKTRPCPMVNSSNGKAKDLAKLSLNKTIVFSEADHGMDLTCTYEGRFEETQNPSSERNKMDRRLFPAINTISHLSQTDRMEKPHTQIDPNAINSLLPASSDSVDMEITRDQTVVIDAKHRQITLSLGKRRSLSRMSAPNKTIVFTEADHGMDMTSPFKGCIEETQNPNISHLNQTDRMEKPNTQIDPNAINSLLPASFDSVDMEITRDQTVVIDAKHRQMTLSLGKRRSVSRMSAPNKTIVFTEADHGMDMTSPFKGCVEETQNPNISHLSQTDRMEKPNTQIDPNAINSLLPASSDSVDMEITRDQTVVNDAKHRQMTLSLGKRRSVSSMSAPNKTIVFSEADHDLEMTNAITGHLEECKSPTHKDEVTERSNSYRGSGFIKTQISSEEDDGIEMIKSHAGHSVKSSHTDGDEAEMTFPSHKAKPTEISIQLSSSGSEYTSVAASLESVESEKRQSVHILSRNKELVNPSTYTMSEGPLPDSSKTQLFSETDNMPADEGTPAPADEVERQVCSSSTTSAVPAPCLPSCQSVAEGSAGQFDRIAFEGTTLISADLTGLGEMSCNAPPEDDVISDEERSHTTNSQNLLTNDSSGVGNDGKDIEKQSRRMSLADIQSKLQNIGLAINGRLDLERGCHTVPIPRVTSPSSPKAREATAVLKAPSGSDAHGVAADLCMEPDPSKLDRQTNRTETLRRISSRPRTPQLFVGVQPKLPRRSVPLPPNRAPPTGHGNVRMQSSQSKVGVAETDVDRRAVRGIYEETLPETEMSSEEDLSGTVKDVILRGCELEASDDVVDAEAIQDVAQGQKRPFPVDGHECDMPAERKMRSLTISSQNSEPSANVVHWDGNVVGIARENPPSLDSLDSSNLSRSTSNQRCEGTFESSSLRTSQYDIYVEHFQQKLEDGSITLREFLAFFGIDTTIHQPRHSVLPENFETNSEPNPAADLMEKHINRPKQRVYEEDYQEVTQIVEKLKTRTRDQDKSLKSTNKALWEAAKTYSEEQLQSFGAKLKERKVYFRKQCKSLSHELKIGLYSKLVHTTQVAEQNITEKIEDMDTVLKQLDKCLNDLQADLTSMDCVEENSASSETKLTLEVKQKELESLNAVLADDERRVFELELEKKSTAGKVRKLRDETVVLEKQTAFLDRLTEWRLLEKTEERAVFRFLHDTVGLKVLFEKPADKTSPGEETEQSVVDIVFQLDLLEEDSLCYAPLVLSLLGQFIENESSWTQKYPTSRHISALLHDVSLVVSRCRLLGEEIHRLLKWGCLSLDILEIGCSGTHVRILFSSLKARAKFELTLGVTPAYPFTTLQLVNFRNYIGSTRIDQVEEIIAAETLAKNYLTRIVKRIHDILLC